MTTSDVIVLHSHIHPLPELARRRRFRAGPQSPRIHIPYIRRLREVGERAYRRPCSTGCRFPSRFVSGFLKEKRVAPKLQQPEQGEHEIGVWNFPQALSFTIKRLRCWKDVCFRTEAIGFLPKAGCKQTRIVVTWKRRKRAGIIMNV